MQLKSLTILLVLAACTPGGEHGRDRPTEEPAVSRTIEEAVAARTPELMRIEGVEGVGQALCDERPCIRVYIRTADVAEQLPKQLDGYPVSPAVTGIIHHRPATP